MKRTAARKARKNGDARDRLVLRVDAVAAALEIGRVKVYRLIGEGVLPSIKIGGSIRVPVSALEEWLQKNSVGGC